MPSPLNPPPRHPAPPVRGAAAAAFAPGGLKDTLAKLTQAIENLAGGAVGSGSSLGMAGGLGGLGGVGMGVASAGLGVTARMGLAPVQVLAQQIQRTMTSTEHAFAASMTQVQRSWKRGAGGFASDFFDALQGQAKKRKGRGNAAGRSTRRAWRGSVDLWRRQTRSLKRQARRWGQRTRRWVSSFVRTARKATSRKATSLGRSARRVRKRTSAWTGRTRRAARGWGRWFARTARKYRRSAASSVAATRRSAGRTAQRWGRSAKRWSVAAGRSARRVKRRLGQTWGGWGRSARRVSRRVGRWGTRTSSRLGKSFGRFRRRAGRRVGVAWGRAGRAFARTGSPRAALGAGARGLMGKGLSTGLGEFNVALGAITSTLRALHGSFENQNESNRHLGRYSGQIGMAFNQLALGDMQRESRLARATEGSAVTLANLTNLSRDKQNSFDRLSSNVGNRLGIAKAVLWNGLVDPWAQGADKLNKMIEKTDPDGGLFGRLVAMPFSFATRGGAYLGALWGGATTKEAAEQAAQAFAAHQQAQVPNAPPAQLDPFSQFIRDNQNLPPIRPIHPIVKI